MNNRLSISVIIPAYNSEKTIEKCLIALHGQIRKPLEVIVVDDGSTDRTVTIARKRAKVIQNTHKKGPGGARNCGADTALGEVLAFVDSDCIPGPMWLENIANVFSDGDVGAVGGGYCCGIDTSFWQLYSHLELTYRRRRRVDFVTTLVSNNMACKKDIFDQIGGFPEAYPVCEDMYLSYKIARYKKIRWLNENGVQHHFKTTLREYLSNQYFFGAESTRFFLSNISILFEDHHQSRSLHFSILLAFLGFSCLIISGGLFMFDLRLLSLIFVLLSAICFTGHMLLHIEFMYYLAKEKFNPIGKAYAVSLLRDLIAGISIFDGCFRYVIRNRRQPCG